VRLLALQGDRRGLGGAARLDPAPAGVEERVIRLLQVELLQEGLAQGIEGLQDRIANELALLRAQIWRIARVQRLQGAAHVMQGCIRVEPDQRLGVTHVLIDRSHVVDGLGQLAERGQILIQRGPVQLRIREQGGLGGDDVAPFLLQCIDEALALLIDVGDVGDAAGGDQQRHITEEFVGVLQKAFHAGAGEIGNVIGRLGEQEPKKAEVCRVLLQWLANGAAGAATLKRHSGPVVAVRGCGIACALAWLLHGAQRAMRGLAPGRRRRQRCGLSL
jgi:hypothetical protein